MSMGTKFLDPIQSRYWRHFGGGITTSRHKFIGSNNY